jgi:diguanylate cyclase (GGDEF)-like protein
MIRQRQPLGIQATIWLAIGLTVVSVVLGGSALFRFRLYRTLQRAERDRVKAVAQAYAAQIAPLLATGRRSQATRFIESLRWHEESNLLALLDDRFEIMASRGNAPLLKAFVSSPRDPDWQPTRDAADAPGRSGEPGPDVALAAVPIRVHEEGELLGTLVYAARVAYPTGNNAEVWRFFGGLILIAATGLVLGFLWLKQKVLQPLSLLARESRGSKRGRGAAACLSARPDEIGRLARTLAEMHVDLEEWRKRVARLERSMDDRVTAETRRIMKELRAARLEVWTDPLTRLGNRRMLDDRFADICQAQQNAGQELSVVMIDLDHFKTLNDTLGHTSGDELLTFTGELLRQCLREQDIAVRYGGDEFLLILPSVSAEEAAQIAERTIRMFAQRASLLQVKPKPTMSAGVASLLKHAARSPQDLLDLADQALYEAKRTGKSQVEAARRNGVGSYSI